MTGDRRDGWAGGSAYDRYMGRWSRKVAGAFLGWLPDPPRTGDWADLGCGTGALSAAILHDMAPASLHGFDGSETFVGQARVALGRDRVHFDVADIRALPLADHSVDAAVSGLVLNFLPDPAEGLREMVRITRPGELVAFYVWDYPGGGMGMIDAFWQAAREIAPEAAELDEAARFPGCTQEGIAAWARAAGLADPMVTTLAEMSRFETFDDFWQPFLAPTGPAPQFAASLGAEAQAALREVLARRLGPGPILLPCRAHALAARTPI